MEPKTFTNQKRFGEKILSIWESRGYFEIDGIRRFYKRGHDLYH